MERPLMAELDALRQRCAQLEQTLAERKRQERRKRIFLEAIVGQLRACIAVMQGRELRYTLVNEAYQAIRPDVRMIGRTFHEVFPEASAIGAEQEMHRAMDTGEPVISYGYHAPIPGRPDAAWDHQIVRLPAEPGEEPSVLVAAWEVTEHKRMEEKLRQLAKKLLRARQANRESQERLKQGAASLQLVIESTGLGTFDYHPLTGELYWSDLAKLHFGLLPDADVDYDVFLSGLHPEDRDRVHRIIQDVLRPGSGGIYGTEYRTLGISDGKERWLSAQGRVFFNDREQPDRLIGTTLDITERKRTEQALHAALAEADEGRCTGGVIGWQDISTRKRSERERELLIAELERSNRELQEFAYISSHDLQEPLRTMTSFVELLALRYRGRLDEDADRYITHAVEAADRMSRLINDLLTYSRVVTREKPFSPVAMNEVFGKVVALLTAAIEERHAEIACDDLPVVSGDGSQLVQLMQNLIGNAVKFAKPDVPPRIRISVTREDDNWIFGVHDNGIGIEPRFHERIFVVFQRLHTREEYPGTGIGLALCRKIVERHGGRIWIESRAGEGSSFRFSLPGTKADPERRPDGT